MSAMNAQEPEPSSGTGKVRLLSPRGTPPATLAGAGIQGSRRKW